MGKWEEYSLGEVLIYEQPTKYIVKDTNYSNKFDIPVITPGQSFILGYTDEKENVFTKVPVIIFDDFTTASRYIDFSFKVKSSAMKILKAAPEANLKYLYYMMKTFNVDSELHKRYWISVFSKIKIVLPSILLQKQIVSILDKATALIEKRREQIKKLDLLIKSQFVEMFGDLVLNSKHWEKRKLGDILIHINNGLARRGNDLEGEIVLRLADIKKQKINYGDVNRIKLSEEERKRYKLNRNDILVIRVNGNPEKVGTCVVFIENNEVIYHNDHLIRARVDNEILSSTYIETLINSTYGRREMKNKLKTSAGQYTISQSGINDVIVLLPPINLQNQFAAFVEKVENEKKRLQLSLDKMELNYKSLMQKCFRGEIVS